LSRRRPCGGGASARQAVFDLGKKGTPVFSPSNARGFIHTEFDDRKEMVGLVGREEG
jgi:hypothetical protein